MDPPLILAIDTTAARCAAVVMSGDIVLAARDAAMARGQAERLFPLIAEMLAEARIDRQALSALGVGIGPGNFTGTRIAVAAARGLALALGIPAVGVSGLEALAFGAVPGPTLACLDARAGRLYVQGFDLGPQGSDAADRPGSVPLLLALDALDSAGLPRGATCLGDHAEALAQATGGTAAVPAFPPAEAIARIAATRFADPALPRPAPVYLRPADAAPPADAPPVLLP